MGTLFLAGNSSVSLKYGSLYITPKIRRVEVRSVIKSMQDREQVLLAMRTAPKKEGKTIHKASVKHMKHLFFSSTEGKITGPALAHLSKAGVPVTYLDEGEIAYEYMPIINHGSPEARIRQVLDPPKITPWKGRSYTKYRIRQLRYLTNGNLPSISDSLLSHSENASIPEMSNLCDFVRDEFLISEDPEEFQSTIEDSFNRYMSGYDPPEDHETKLIDFRSNSQIREAMSILSSTIHYQILLSGLLPHAGGYISSLQEDLISELEPLVVLKPWLKEKQRNKYRKLVLTTLDDPRMDLRKRILKAAMTYAKYCRNGEPVDKPALVRVPLKR